MDESEDVYRFRVNGSLLQKYNGKHVSMIGNVLNTNSNGTSVEVRTLDNLIATISMCQPLTEPLKGWVEFRGIGQGKSNITCDSYTIFSAKIGATFDPDAMNEAIMLMNSTQNPWTPKNV